MLTDLLSSAIRTGLQEMAQHTASAATYQRGERSITVDVTWGRCEVLELVSGMNGTVIDMQDAIVTDYSDLAEAFGTPQPGDLIIQSGITRKVLPAGGDDHVFRWMGNDRQAMRIHCKVVGEA